MMPALTYAYYRWARPLMEERGATAVEYGLVVTLISVAIILGATALGFALNATFGGVASQVHP